MHHPLIEGILLVDKPKGKTSFSLIGVLRKILNVPKIGHAGTLDPMATGVMVLLIGKKYTTQSDSLLSSDKAYVAEITLGATTDTYDAEGKVVAESGVIPTLEQIENALKTFQGSIEQTPPMFSAKKVGGKKLYELARLGKEIERKKTNVEVHTTLIHYNYPKLTLEIDCSKGTYVRSIAHDLGILVGSGAHLSALVRSRSGSFLLGNCIPGHLLFESSLSDAKELVLKNLIKT